MSLRTFLFTVSALVLPIGAAHAQSITPVSITHEAEGFARLDWTSPVTPDSITHLFDSGSGLGDSSANAIANNNGITSVAARGQGIGGAVLNADGYNLVVSGFMQGHSNLAALADASFASTATMVFDIDQAMQVTLDCWFNNSSTGPAGVVNGQAFGSLTGPGGTPIFSFTHPATNLSLVEFTEVFLLQPGQYELSVSTIGSRVFPPSIDPATYVSTALITINVPAPGSIALLTLLGIAHPRRRR